MESTYSLGKVPSRDGGKPLSLDPDLEVIMSSSRDYDTLLWAWEGWHDAVGPNIRDNFTDLVTYMNKAAEEYGMCDVL